MTLTIRTVIAALNIASIAPAFTGGSEGAVQPPVQNTATETPMQNGQYMQAYVAESGRGTWLFPPDQNGGGSNG
jgi:hypothetical protein